MSRDIILPGGDTLKLWDSSYTASEMEAILTKALRQPGRNLLDNAYFVGGGSQQGGGQLPINQRGQTEYADIGYTIDRWLILPGVAGNKLTVTLQGDGAHLKCTNITNYWTSWRTRIEKARIAGFTGNLTFSVLYKGCTANDAMWLRVDNNLAFLAESENAALGDGLLTVTFPASAVTADLLSCGIFFRGLGEATIVAAGLEPGDHQTIAHQDADGNWVLNDPPDFGLELAKCQRYQLFGLLSSIHMSKATNNTARVFVPAPVTLRGNPAIVGTIGSNIRAYSVATNSELGGFTLDLNEVSKNGIFLNVKDLSEPAYIWFYSGAGFDCNL